MQSTEWIEAFNQKIKTRTFEQFNLLICDLDRSEGKQRELLSKILFDTNGNLQQGYKNPGYWCDYIEFTFKTFPDRKLQLQRLINKSLELLNEKECKDNRQYATIHLMSAQLKSENKEIIRYFQNTMFKRNIGTKFAAIFITWAEYEYLNGGALSAIDVLTQGIHSKAEPRHLLAAKMTEYRASLEEKKVVLYDDGTIKIRSDNNLENELSDSDEEATTTVKMDINESSNITAVKESSVSSVSKVPRSILSGRCIRVEAASSESETNESYNSSNQATNLSSESSKKAKNNLSSYIDDKLLNFDPIAIRNQIVERKNKMNQTNDFIKNNENQNNLKTESNEISKIIGNKNDSNRKRKIESDPVNNNNNKMVIYANTFDTSSDIESSFEDTVKLSPSSMPANVDSIPTNPNQLIPTNANVIQVNNISPNKINRSSSLPIGILSSTKKKRVSFAKLQPSDLPLIHSNNNDNNNNNNDNNINISDNNHNSYNNDIFQDIKRHFQINNKDYFRLNILGKGGSSNVYKIISKSDGNIYAFKRVDVKDSEDSDAVFANYANEISLLQKLKGSPHIIELIDYDVNKENMYVAMILEPGDIDLAKVLSQKMNELNKIESGLLSSTGSMGLSNVSKTNKIDLLDPFFCRMVWKDMLLAVDHIHEHRIVHGDLKPANFVFVKGHLKLIDFGIAKSFNSDTTNIYRESQIGTINYMAPEAIAPSIQQIETDDNLESNKHHDMNKNKMKLGRPSDIWSLGCILYQMIYGRPPFASLTTIQKLTTIPNPNYIISYPDNKDIAAIESMKSCLIFDPSKRSKIKGENGLINKEFLIMTHNNSNNNNNNNIQNENIIKKQTIISKPSTPVNNIPIFYNESQSVSLSQDQVSMIIDTMYKSLPSTITLNENQKSDFEKKVQDLIKSNYKSNLTRSNSNNDNNYQKHDIQNNNSHSTNIMKIQSSSKSNLNISRPPLKTLPINIQQQIQQMNFSNKNGSDSMKDRGLQSVNDSKRATKWMKPMEVVDDSKLDMRSVLEKRITEMRKFLEVDQDNTMTESTFDISDLGF
eukprot:gene6260-8621_t